MCKSSVCNFASLCCYISLKSSSPRLREVSFLVIVTTKSQFPTFQQMQETSFTSIRIYHVCIARCILRCNVLWCCCLSQLSIGAAKKLSGLSWFTTQRLYCIIKEFGISKTGPWSQALNLAEVCVFATAWNIANVVNLVFTFLFPVFFSLSLYSFSYPSLFLPFVSCEFFFIFYSVAFPHLCTLFSTITTYTCDVSQVRIVTYSQIRRSFKLSNINGFIIYCTSTSLSPYCHSAHENALSKTAICHLSPKRWTDDTKTGKVI